MGRHQTAQQTLLTNMNFFVLFALAGAAVALPSSRNEDEGAAAALACTAGTNLGANLATAFTTCAATMRKVVKKMQLSRNDEQCYSYEDIMNWVQAEYADDACVLQTIGWMNENYEANEDVITSDVISLDPVVTAPLFAGHADCVAEVMDYVEEHECVSTFTADQQTSLLETANNIASYEFFLHLFEQGCMNFLASAGTE